MKKESFIFFVLVVFAFASCKSHRNIERHASKVSVVTKTTDINMSKKLRREIDSWLGVVYKYGGADKNGIDCSALVYEFYKNVYGKALPRTTKQQYKICQKVLLHDLKEGDLVFFHLGTKDVSHVGIYLGEHKFVHASVSKGVVISDLEDAYYKKYFVSGGRISNVR